MSNKSRSRAFLTMLIVLLAAAAAVQPVAAQTNCDSACSAFITKVEAAVTAVTANLKPTQPIIIGGQEVAAHGSNVANYPPTVLVDYADGLKAVGVQRIEFNPAVSTINIPAAEANLDILVWHIRELGLQLAINPEYDNGEFPVNTFQDFLNVAMQTYPALAARYKPDNFVIVHEPTTMAARMGIAITPAQWVSFIQAVEPLIKQASPHTNVGAGDCVGCNESDYFSAFAALPTCNANNLSSGCLDFLTVDLYSVDFATVEAWVQIAQTNKKGIYMEETWAPTYLPSTLPTGIQANPAGQEAYAVIGSVDTVFERLDQDWLTGIIQFASAEGMQAVTPFTTEAFFLYVNTPTPSDEATNASYLQQASKAIQTGQLTTTGQTYLQDAAQYGVKMATTISNASYATLPTVFNPSCGTAYNPCLPDSVVAPDMIASTFGVDLANQVALSSTWPTTLGNTTATLVDSTNTSYPVPLYSVQATQINYLVPSAAASGPATLTITSGDGTITTGIVEVAPVSPGLYTYFANGQGTAAAVAVCAGTCTGWPNQTADGQFWQYTFVANCTAEPCEAPLTWGVNDTVVIAFYGTGIRHLAALANITATLGGTSVPVQYAGLQGTDTGLDQVNVLIPNNFRGAGQVNLVLTTQDTVNKVSDVSNPVAINLQ